MRKRRLTSYATLGFGLAGLGLGLGACTSSTEEPPPDPPVDQTTWHQEVAPIVHEHCVSCHRPGGAGPFSLMTYADVADIAGFMLQKVEAGEMPPWDARETTDCTPRFGWQNDPRLTADEVATLSAWVDDGAPEGDAATAAPLPEPPETDLGGVTHQLTPAAPFTTSGERDQQICFVLDPELTSLKYLTGLQVVPGNLEVVHHAVLLAVPPEGADAIRQAGGTDGVFDCFGIPAVEGIYNLGVWVPGATPFEPPAGTGIPLAAGSLVVMNIHYHPFKVDHDPDLTTVELRLVDEAPPRMLLLSGVGNSEEAPILQPGPGDRGAVEFRIPAGVGDHVERMVFPIELDNDNPQRFPITAMFPHMHYVGVDVELRITRANPLPGEPAEECLIKVPGWDFEWQRTYFYDADLASLPTVGDGDVVEITCRYDNTMENPFVRRMLMEEGLSDPVDVFLGEETTNEMCLVGLGIII